MPGYNPNCNNCAKCNTCRGNGTIEKTVQEKASDSNKTIVVKKRVTCSTCKGVGGKPMAGKHDHR